MRELTGYEDRRGRPILMEGDIVLSHAGEIHVIEEISEGWFPVCIFRRPIWPPPRSPGVSIPRVGGVSWPPLESTGRKRWNSRTKTYEQTFDPRRTTVRISVRSVAPATASHSPQGDHPLPFSLPRVHGKTMRTGGPGPEDSAPHAVFTHFSRRLHGRFTRPGDTESVTWEDRSVLASTHRRTGHAGGCQRDGPGPPRLVLSRPVRGRRVLVSLVARVRHVDRSLLGRQTERPRSSRSGSVRSSRIRWCRRTAR
jgi:hypothetical protein